MINWIRMEYRLPPEGDVVETKIDDHKGIRKVVCLRRKGMLMFFKDWSMYVYYTPTHWRPVQDQENTST